MVLLFLLEEFNKKLLTKYKKYCKLIDVEMKTTCMK